MLDMKLFNGENDPLEEKQVQNKPSTFGQILDNVGAWGNAAYANTREIGLSEDIRDLYERLYNGDYTSDEEYNRLSEEFQKKQDERRKYKQEYEESMKVLNQNDSYLKDFTEIGGTVQGIGTQLKDTAMAAGAGAVTMGALGAGAGGIGAIPAALVGAAKGATWGNRVGAFHQAYQDAKVNAIDAWEKVLQEGGTAEQAEQAYNDALIANLPTEALDVIGNLYFGSKILGNAVSSNMAQKLSKSALGKTAEKVSRFDLPEVVGTNVAKKFGTTAGKIAGGVTASTLEGIGESIQEPWQDYATERAVDIQRRQYDPTNKLNKDVRDFSVLGDGGLLDYYTTPEGRETAWKSFKMGAAFGGVGSALSASQFTGLGTAHQDSIDASRQLASEFSEGGEFFGKDTNYEDVRKMMGNIYGLTEDERDSLSKEDVYRMYVDYWTNKYSSGGLFGSGNRQEVNAVMQADLINALTGQETNRTDQLNDYSRRYVDKYALNPDNSIFNDIKQQQEEALNQEEQVQEEVEDSEQRNGEDVAMTGKFKEGNFSPETAEEAKERNGGVLGSVKNAVNGVIDKVAKKSEWYDLPDKFGKQWVWADDGMDSDDNRTYRNTETGRLANVERVKVGKKGKYNRYTYRVKDITNGRNDPNTIGVGGYAGVGDKNRNNEFTNVKQVEKYLNLPRTNRDTSFMADSQHGNEQGGIKQALPQEDGVIASSKLQTDAEGNQVYNGRIIQSKDAVNVHSMDDLDNYFREHGDLMSTDLYAEVARGMMRFGIGKDNKTSIVLDLANDKSGALGSKTTWMENPNDPNSAIAKAVIRLYAGADLVTAAHEIAHLGWINLSAQDKNTFARWAIDTEEEFVARVLGYQYDNNFRAYLLEALTNQGEGGSLDSQALWQKIKEQGATKQTIDILNNHANDQNIADAIDERFAWEFSNWFAQGYIKGEKPHNVIERILQKACQSMGDALRLLYDTDRYLNDKNYRLGASGRDVGDIFNRISASRKDRGQQTVMPQQEEPVSLRTEMRQPVEAPYNLGQGFDEAEFSDLSENPDQGLSSFYGDNAQRDQSSPWWRGVPQGGYTGMNRNVGTIAGTSPVATTPVTQEEDPEPKKKRSKEHKEWEKRQQEKKEAQEKAIKDARDNVKTKLNAVKDLYNKKASVEDLTKAVDELYEAAMSAKDLSNEKEHTDLIKDALKKVSQFRSKIDELRKKKPQTVKYTPPMTDEERSQYLTPDDVYNYINNMQGEEPRTPISEGTPATSPEGQYMSDIINDRTGQQEQPTKPTREDFSSPQWGDQYGEDELLKKMLGDKEGMTKTQGIEELQKQKMDKMKKDIETKAKKINQSLNAKNTKFSIDELGQQIDGLETLLQAYDDEHLAQLERGDGGSFYDKKFVDDQEKLIRLLRTKLRDKEEESKDREYNEKLSRSKQNIRKLVAEADKLLKEDTLANKDKIEEILSNLNDELIIYSSIPSKTKADEDFFKDAYQKQIDIGNTLREKEVEEERKKEEEKRKKEEGKKQKELDSMDTTNEYGNDVEEQKEWYKNKITTKDRKKIQSVSSDEYAKGLTLYGKLVYANALEKFGKSKSTQVNSLAKQNALLFARMCERIAKIRNNEKVEAIVEPMEGYNAKTIADEIMVRANAGWSSSLYGSFTHREYEKNMFRSRLIDRVFNRTINLFEITTPSTFVHEATHWYQLELEIVAEQNPNGQAAKDLKALYDWAEYKGKEEETKRAKEMSSGEERIYLKYIDAIENAKNQAAKEAALETWRDEKIARATEEYMREGNSPIEKLKDVFERFKQWITSFYRDAKPLTSELSPNVKKALDRMILTDEELKKKYGKLVQNENASATNQTSPSDTKMQASSKEEIARNRKPTVWSISKTGGKTAIRRSKFGVGKDVSGQIYFHKDYAEDVIDADTLKKARDIAHREGFTEDKYNCMMYDTHTGVVRFDEAPDFDTSREPITGKYLRVYPDGHTEASKGGANQERQIWHHKWLWVKEDYKGFDVQASRDWSEKWLEANKGKGRPSGKKSEWDKKLKDIGLGKYIEDTKMQEGSTGFVKQESGNPRSSQNQIPAVMTHVEWKKGTVNADIGGGKYDTATNYMKEQGVDSSVFDPYNRTPEHNLERFNAIQEAINKHGGVDTVTVANVLNVIPDEWNMLNVIHQAAEAVKQDGVAYFYVYENKKDNIVREVKGRGVQRNEVTEKYEPRVKQFFDDVNVVTKKKETLQNGKKKTSSCKVIEARKPKFMPDNRAFWTMNANSNDTSANNIKQLDLSKKNAEHTALQVASKNAQNQTRLNAKSEQVLEKLFRRLVRDKKITDAPWNKGNIDRLKKYTNIADKGTVPRDLKLNPNDKRTMDAEYLDALQKVNDYLHEKYPYLKNIYRGADGHWRFEFSDKDAQLVDGLDEREKVTTLGKVLKHDNLYKFYPKLKNMHVSIVSNERMNRIMGDNPNSEYDGAYDPTSKYIYLNKDSFKEEDMRKVLLHEVQHAIQDIEGLANGDSAFNEENYETSAGEREANQTEERANMSDEELQNNPRRTNPKEKTVLSDVRAITDTKMQEKSTPITRTQLLQDLANLTRGSAIELNAITVHDEMSKQYMREQMAERGFTEKEAEDLIKDLEKIADEVVEIAKDHPYMQSWQNRGKVIHNEDGTVKEIVPNRVEDKDGKLGWLPVRNAFRSNGEYKVNMDLGTLCMKREAFDALMQIAVKEGFGKNLGISQIEGLKEVLKKYKYATACDVCYVETRRARMLQYANNVSYDWDSVLMALDLDDGNKLGSIKREFDGIIEKDGVKYTQQQVLDMMTSTEEDENGVKQYVKAFDMFVPDDRKRVKKNPKDNKSPDLDTGTTADKMYKIAKLFKEDSTLAGWFNPDLLLTSSIENGTGYLACNYGGHTNIINTLGGLDSQNTPKPIESFIVYDPLSWKDANGLSENQLMKMLGTKEVEVTNEDGTKEIRTVVDVERAAESLYDIGGGRLQAFSDFNPILFLDYCQLIADYAARRMPIHAYTKVPALVELFGETRMMINMSLLPEIVDGVDADHLGLKKNPKTGEWEYAWHKDSFPPELAFEYRKRKQYEGHAGIIAIGISKEHIIKMMADPEIDMIIPYHKSGMAKGVQIKTLLERATDYTKTQTMKYPKYPKDKGGKSREAEIKAKIKADTGINGDVYLNYSRVLFTVGDPRKAAKEYVRRCEKYGCTPAFDEFKNYDGYYKLLEDFRGYDNNGNPVLQEAARFKLPDNWNEILKKQLSAREKMIKYKESMAQNEALLRDMRKVFTPQRIDGEIKERMITALRKIFKYDSSVSREQKNKIKEIYPSSWRDKYSNVRCLPQQAFLDELEKEYQKNMSAEDAAKAVEVYRRRDGIVYGFSRGKSIFLNEDYMNANTPAHEFTHIWAKIAQAVNPTLWKEGVGLLQQHEKKLWKEVQNDPLYANIKNNDDAIASEVLARLTGRENERFIAEVLDPKKKLNKLDKLTQQIKDWCTRMFTKVRSLFDTNNTKPLTLGEFVRMPLKAIWESQEQSKFTKGVSAQFKNKKFKEQNSGMQGREQNFDAINSLNNEGEYIWKGDQSDTKMQEKSVQRPLNQQRAITILDGKFDGGEAINFVNEILDGRKKGETRTTKTLTRKEDLGITNDKKNVVGVIRLGEPRLLKKYEVDKNGNIKLDKNGDPIKTQDYIDSMIEGTDYDIDDNNLAKNGKPKYFYPIKVLRDYRNNPKKVTKHVSQAYKEYDDTKLQEQSTPKTYPDQNKDVYSVTFTKSAQRVGENQKKMAFYRKNDSYWRENKNKDGSITFTRKLPFKHHQRTLVYDDINGLTVGKKKKTKFREYYEAVKDQLIKWWFNDKHFLYKAAKNAGALNSYMRMMVMKDQGAVASAAIEDGIVKHNSKKGERTKSLNSIIEAVGEANQTDFLNYCEAFRILDLADRGIRQKMDKKLAQDTIDKVKNSKNAKLFEQQRQYFVEYNHELLWVLVDGGFITEEQYDKFIEVDPNFVPLSKNMEELEDYVGGIGVSKKMINAEHPIHKIGTSMREVKNPFLEMQRRTVEYYVKASRNKAGRIFVDDIAGAIARGANGNVVAINQGMVRKLKSRDQNGNPISMDGKQNIFYVWNEGEKEYYQVADREIYEALRSFDSEQMGALKKIVDQTLGRTSRLVRNTATMTPDFGLRNLCRDNVEAFISSEHGFLPFIDAFWGMYQMANDTQWFREYQQMNGEPFNTLNRDGEDVATVEHDVTDNIKIWKTYFPLIKKDFREFTDKNRSIPARAKSLLLLGTDVVGLHSLYKMNKKLNDYMEVGTRIGEYRNARMGYHGLYGRLFEGKVKGNRIFTNDKDLVYATNDELFSAYKSKDITLNFGQHGTIGKELNRIIPFFNASLQGIYKIGNTIDNMVHGDDTRIREELLFKCILMGAMGMAAALAGQGDDDYEEAPEYEHESFWILPNGVRIAKDQLFGRLVGNTVEKATRQYLKDGDVKKMELVQDILGNFMIDKCVPALVDLGWGTVGNYDSFRKKSVTPEYMADKLGYLQKDLSTSKAGVDISEALYKVFGIDVGAKKVDFVISKTLSNLGKYATNLYELTGDNQKMTRGAEPEDKGGFSEWSKELPYPMNTIVGTFATNRNSFQSISDFYERYRELKKLSSDESIMSKNEKKAWEAYQAAYKKDKQYRDALKAIKQDKSLTGAQKRQKADKIFKQQISMSRKLHDWEKKHGLI